MAIIIKRFYGLGQFDDRVTHGAYLTIMLLSCTTITLLLPGKRFTILVFPGSLSKRNPATIEMIETRLPRRLSRQICLVEHISVIYIDTNLTRDISE